MDDFEPFHSAVNRIPVLRNIATRAAALGNLSPELFGESNLFPATTASAPTAGPARSTWR